MMGLSSLLKYGILILVHTSMCMLAMKNIIISLFTFPSHECDACNLFMAVDIPSAYSKSTNGLA